VLYGRNSPTPPPVILAIAALITAITGLIKVLKSKKK
jgi:hypothetical protein